MNKKGFTLVELLAVIVVLGIIGTIAGSIMAQVKKNTAKEEIEKIKNDIKALGPDVYLDLKNMSADEKDDYICEGSDGDKWCFSIKQLHELGYLKSGIIKSPYDNSECEGGLIISTNNGNIDFDENIVCDVKKQDEEDDSEETENYDDEDEESEFSGDENYEGEYDFEDED